MRTLEFVVKLITACGVIPFGSVLQNEAFVQQLAVVS